ncbi:MAG: pre-peptidase C-terminal domain-containing protein, partial [Cyanobacteria bacterium P01_F01_bin.86]
QQFVLPTTIGGQSLGAFYNQDGIPTGIRLRIEEPTMSVTLQTAFNQTWYTDFIGNVIDEFEPLETDGPEDVTFFLQPGEGYEIAADAGSAEVTYYDSLADVPPPTDGGDTVPQVGVSISETELIETEGTETTITFTLSEPPPEDGVVVYLDSSQDPLVGSVLSQFNVLEAEITGGNFPVPNGDSSGFFFTITEQTASITVSVFDELTVPDINPFAVQEGILGVNFALQPQAGYTIDPDASEISLTIADNPDSKNQVVLSGEPETLVESEGTVGVHTFTVSNDLPSEGITVSVSTPDLSEFDLDAIEVNGGSIAEVRSDGFDFTITEQIATIGLPVLDDGISEGSETATFTLEPGDSYETNVDGADIATFILADSVDEVSVPEEIEGNDTLAEANALGLSVDNPVTFLNGFIAGDFFYDPSEDVDFYTFDLEAGQTVSLDIDSSEWNTLEVFEYPVIFPALNEVQTPDTELRLFDAQGNELAANNDGAAPGEDFSRDPYLEFTAETAGTYYVGVSALGNRNYDPYIDRSGSGWTFPEVGVFYGPYELTATLTESTIEFDIVGTEDAETLVGDAEDNNIEGLGGEDTIAGGLANDLILGGDGDDVLRGDRNSRSTQDGEPGGDDIIFGGEGNDRIGGKAGNDILSGDAGDDFIWGDDGDDILMGVSGNDILTGDNSSSGSGSDTFVFGNGDGTDTITDFEVGIDFIGLVEGELVFEDLSFTQDGDNTLLGVSDSGETLAILNNVQASLLDASSFVIVPDVSNPQEALALI